MKASRDARHEDKFSEELEFMVLPVQGPPDMVGAVEVMFIDEASQFFLAT